MKKFVKWLPVLFAGGIAIFQAICEKNESEFIEELEERVAKLEGKN